MILNGVLGSLGRKSWTPDFANAKVRGIQGVHEISNEIIRALDNVDLSWIIA